jgi:hypothetical protein
MSYVGWVLFVLAVVWGMKSLSFSHRKRLHLDYYIAYLLLDDGIREKHKRDFQGWIRSVEAPNASVLAMGAWSAIDRMADQLAEAPGTSSWAPSCSLWRWCSRRSTRGSHGTGIRWASPWLGHS